MSPTIAVWCNVNRNRIAKIAGRTFGPISRASSEKVRCSRGMMRRTLSSTSSSHASLSSPPDTVGKTLLSNLPGGLLPLAHSRYSLPFERSTSSKLRFCQVSFSRYLAVSLRIFWCWAGWYPAISVGRSPFFYLVWEKTHGKIPEVLNPWRSWLDWARR